MKINSFRKLFKQTITILTATEGTMNHGTYIAGTPIEKVINCCVQPVDEKMFYAEYGYAIDAEYKVFCGVDTDIKTGSTMIYKDINYTVEKLVDWNEYYILFLKAVS